MTQEKHPPTGAYLCPDLTLDLSGSKPDTPSYDEVCAELASERRLRIEAEAQVAVLRNKLVSARWISNNAEMDTLLYKGRNELLCKALQEIVAYAKALDGNWSVQHTARIAGTALAGAAGESTTA